MPITSVFPFFLLMAVFVGAGYFFCLKFSPYNSLVPQLLTKKGYYQELESMRGILALAVVVHHALVYYFLLYNHTSIISGPNAGFYSQLGTAPVSFFFFITGFLFWSKLISDPKPQPGKVHGCPLAPPWTGLFGWGCADVYTGRDILPFQAARQPGRSGSRRGPSDPG